MERLVQGMSDVGMSKKYLKKNIWKKSACSLKSLIINIKKKYKSECLKIIRIYSIYKFRIILYYNLSVNI